jgi:hypothetical protein
MSVPSEAELFFWNDPDDLLNALYQVSREPVPELRDSVERLLEHDDPDIREEAIRILLTRWKDLSFRPQVINVLQSDPAPNVKSAAAFGVAATSTDENRAQDSQLLLSVLRDEGEHLDVRAAAYDALMILHRKGVGEGGWPFTTKKSEFNPARDVDWSWIRSL